MMRKAAGNSSLLAMVALVAAVAGCDANDARNAGTQLATPVTPTALQITISSDRSSIRAGTSTSALITWSAILVPQGVPVPNGTIANVSTTLGSLNSIGGSSTAQIEMFGGTASVRLFAPTTGQGTARVRVEIDGVVAVVEITITAPAGPPTPAPTAATITLGADTLVVLEAEATKTINLVATVLGSDADPFDNAPVQFSAPIGTFATSASSTSDIVPTDNNGEATEALTVTTAQLTAFGPGSTFTITATLFTEGGGTKSATVTITIVRADDPEVPFSLEIISITPDSTMARGSGPQTATIIALLLNQFDQPFDGALVTFSTALGALSLGDGPSANIDTTDAAGLASVLLTVTQDQIDAFAGTSFQVMASSPGVTSDTAPITVTGAGDEDLVPTNVTLFTDFNFVEDDLDTVDEELNLIGLVTDQNGDPLDGITVTFSSTFGTPDPTTDDTGTSTVGEAESVLTLDDTDIRNFGPNTFTITATITTSSGTDTSSLVINVIRPPLASFVPIPVACGVGDSRYNFDNTSTFGPGTTWVWDFDVVTGATSDDTSFEPPTQDLSLLPCAVGGFCEIKLTATNEAGVSTASHTVAEPCP